MKGQFFRCGKHKKEAFSSKRQAEERLTEVLAEERRDVSGKKPCRVHFDEGCGFWHLTSQHRNPAGIYRELRRAKKLGRL